MLTREHLRGAQELERSYGDWHQRAPLYSGADAFAGLPGFPFCTRTNHGAVIPLPERAQWYCEDCDEFYTTAQLTITEGAGQPACPECGREVGHP